MPPKVDTRSIDWRSVAFVPGRMCAKCIGKRMKLARAGSDWNLDFECLRCEYIEQHVSRFKLAHGSLSKGSS